MYYLEIVLVLYICNVAKIFSRFSQHELRNIPQVFTGYRDRVLGMWISTYNIFILDSSVGSVLQFSSSFTEDQGFECLMGMR